jgi:hypothetical protein
LTRFAHKSILLNRLIKSNDQYQSAAEISVSRHPIPPEFACCSRSY